MIHIIYRLKLYYSNIINTVVPLFSLDEEFLKELAPHLMNRYAVFPWGPCHQVVRVVYMGKSYLAINRTINDKSNVTLDLSVPCLLHFNIYDLHYTSPHIHDGRC